MLFVQMYRLAAEPFFLADYKKSDFLQMNAATHLNTTCWCRCSYSWESLFPGSFRTHRRQGFPRRNRHFTGGVGCERPQRRMAQSVVLVQAGGANLAGYRGYLCGPDIYDRVRLSFIPRWGYYGAAWARLVSEAAMVAVSFWLNRRFYPMPYQTGRILGYVALALVLYGVSVVVDDQVAPAVPRYACYAALLLLYFYYAVRREKIDLRALVRSAMHRGHK